MIKNISVIGAGTMGHGIAHVFARNGYKVSLYDAFPACLEAAPKKMREELQFLADAGYIEQEKVEEALNNIFLYGDLELAVKDADYVIEAIPEKMELKQELFKKLDKMCSPNTIFASNTSSLKLGEMIKDLPESRKAKCMISHWYNPSYLLPIAELSKFGNMSDEDYAEVYALYENSDKKPVTVHKDVPGMIANRLLHALCREAFHIIDDGIGEAKDVDNALMYGPCFRFATTGLQEVADMGGLDIWCTVEDSLFPELCTDIKASNSLRKHFEAGELGVKSGKGYFEYPGSTAEDMQKEFYDRLLTQLVASKNY